MTCLARNRFANSSVDSSACCATGGKHPWRIKIFRRKATCFTKPFSVPPRRPLRPSDRSFDACRVRMATQSPTVNPTCRVTCQWRTRFANVAARLGKLESAQVYHGLPCPLDSVVDGALDGRGWCVGKFDEFMDLVFHGVERDWQGRRGKTEAGEFKSPGAFAPAFPRPL